MNLSKVFVDSYILGRIGDENAKALSRRILDYLGSQDKKTSEPKRQL
ncbi:MAG: hypothetical protein PWP39_1429 [Pyrococcus sp.]|nr:hypothetical protein [Pyrococcus sp.]